MLAVLKCRHPTLVSFNKGGMIRKIVLCFPLKLYSPLELGYEEACRLNQLFSTHGLFEPILPPLSFPLHQQPTAL